MLDRNILQGRGFRNVTRDNTVVGFQFELRNPNYRGTSASLLDGIDVIVDGEQWEHSVPTWTVQGREYTFDELRASDTVRWQLDETATVTVPKPGGLSDGIHEVQAVVYLRRPYFPPLVSRSAFDLSGTGVIVPPVPESGLRFGVSTYSYSGDMYTSMDLEDVFADIADIGATGIEILGEGNVTGYPTPSTAWIDRWQGLVDTYKLTPTNFGSWVDTAMWHDRDLTAEEGAEQIRTDLRLASKLGFSSIRPKFGVTSWELDPHPIWAEAVERSLDLATELDVVICPEIHSPTPIKHPVTQGYIEFIERTQASHFRLLVDTGIFQTVGADDGHEGVEVEEGKTRPAFMEPLRVPVADLVEILPYVHFIQAKFFEVDNQLVDLHIPWDQIIPALLDAGWNGWLSSEYEGRRELGRGRDQVRRQHALLRRLITQH